MGHKGEKSLVAAALELLCMTAQRDQVLLPLQAVIHGPEDTQQVQFVVNSPDQAVDAHVPGGQPQAVQALQKISTVSPAVRRHGVIEVTAGGLTPNLRQPVRGEAEHRRPENGD